MKPLLSVLFCGTLFGAGLAISGMINPEKVVGFLDLSANWDPSLAFVMGGALLIAAPLFHLTLKQGSPKLVESFSLPTRTQIDKRLVIGAALFGIGWGLAGICPGPALAQLAQPTTETFLFIGTLLVGRFLSMKLFA